MCAHQSLASPRPGLLLTDLNSNERGDTHEGSEHVRAIRSKSCATVIRSISCNDVPMHWPNDHNSVIATNGDAPAAREVIVDAIDPFVLHFRHAKISSS